MIMVTNNPVFLLLLSACQSLTISDNTISDYYIIVWCNGDYASV